MIKGKDYKIPLNIRKRYPGGFKSHKRQLVRLMLSHIKEMRDGCAYFPGGTTQVDWIEQHLQSLADDLRVKVWGK